MVAERIALQGCVISISPWRLTEQLVCLFPRPQRKKSLTSLVLGLLQLRLRQARRLQRTRFSHPSKLLRRLRLQEVRLE